MLIEYKIKFQQDGITITQRIEPDALDGVAAKQQDSTSNAALRKENHLSRVAPKPGAAAGRSGSSAGGVITGDGAGEGISGDRAGEGAGEGISGDGAGEGISGDRASGSQAGRVVVLGPVIINCPSGNGSNS